MNNYGVLTTKAEKEAMDYDLYEYAKLEGKYYLHLDFRAWGREAFSLVCYFSDKKGKLIRLYAWRRRDSEGKEIYTPRETDIDMELVEDDTYWECTIGKNHKGNLEWKKARQITASEYRKMK